MTLLSPDSEHYYGGVYSQPYFVVFLPLVGDLLFILDVCNFFFILLFNNLSYCLNSFLLCINCPWRENVLLICSLESFWCVKIFCTLVHLLSTSLNFFVFSWHIQYDHLYPLLCAIRFSSLLPFAVSNFFLTAQCCFVFYVSPYFCRFPFIWAFCSII